MDSDDDMHDDNDVDSLEDYYSGDTVADSLEDYYSGDTVADSDDDNDADYDFGNDSDEDPEAIMIYRYQIALLEMLLWLSTAQGRESILEFPQMRQLELSHLPNMVDFYSTGISRSQEPLIIPFFNQQIAVPVLEILQLESMESVRTMWHNKYPVSWCFDLKKLCLRKCENLQTVFPSDFLEGLQSLQTLKISNCRSLKEIFEIDSINVVPPWKKLSLHSQNPQGYLAFQNLKSLEVDICHSLKYLFLTSVGKGLGQLEVLHIINCEVLEEIVVNENGPEAVAPMFLFHQLSSLELRGLRQLKRFYEQDMYTLGCPFLKILEVYNCGDMELLFQGKSLQDHEVHKQPLFLVNKDTFPIVEELKLRLRGTMEIWGGQFSRESFGKLRKLEIEDSPNISVVIPSRMLQVLHNLKQLTLRSCNSVKEVIQVEGVVQYETLLLPQLTEMHLEDLHMLTHLVRFGTFGIGLLQLLQNLHHLHVSKCGKLINIVSPSMAKSLVQLKKLSITACSMVKEIVGDDDDTCFSNNTFAFPSLEEMEVKELPRLTHLYNKIPGLGHNLQKLRILEISSCGKLDILFTLSLAKTLVQLEKLTVGGCCKVKEIVENEGGGDEATDVHEIIFTKLRELNLNDLPILKSFCSATYTFIFPCLTDMSVIECPEMEYFCKGDSITEMLEGVKAGNFLSYWENNLNATMQKMFMEVKEHPKEEDSQETIPDDQEGPEEEDFEGGSGSLRQRSS